MSRRAEGAAGAVVGAPRALRVSSREPAPALIETVREVAADVPVAAVGPTGAAGVDPLLVATDGGTTRFYATPAPDEARAVARATASAETPPTADAVAEHEPGAATMPTATEGPLAVGRRDVLGRAGWVRPTSLADHEAGGGLAALAASSADAVFDRVGDVRGRGWGDAAADEPVGERWRAARDADGDPAVVLNAHGNPADRLLLESTPVAAIEGALVAARAVGADDVYVYANEADGLARERAAEAAASLAEAVEVAIDVVPGPDEYKAAEPTMALEAIEGNHRLEARRRPPGPETYGLFGRPTLVHTARTLAQVERGLAADREPTRLVTVTGDVTAPATVELPEGAPLSDARPAVDVVGGFKAACVGGRFGGVAADLDVPSEPASLADAGLGTEGTVEVLADGRCLVAFAGERAAFAEAANCGRCVPCREGSTQLARLLREVYDGTFEPDAIDELARVMVRSSLCAFGVEASRPATTAMRAFEAEFRAHADGTCPTGACDAGSTTDPATEPPETPT